jgi:predicted RNA-binding Zn ribbon-like protein
MTFQLAGGHPALDLVNTLDWRFGTREPQDLLASYDDLLRFTEQSKLLISAQVRRLRRSADRGKTARALEECTELREALAEIFYARLDGCVPPAAARARLEQYFKAARLEQKVNWEHSPRLEWEWPPGNDARLPLWALAISASDLMTSEAVDRVRGCDNPECRWLFLDTSKNHSRRWCDMKLCGNRMKARRFKAHKGR